MFDTHGERGEVFEANEADFFEREEIMLGNLMDENDGGQDIGAPEWDGGDGDPEDDEPGHRRNSPFCGDCGHPDGHCDFDDDGNLLIA
jgi:hypothetical protein